MLLCFLCLIAGVGGKLSRAVYLAPHLGNWKLNNFILIPLVLIHLNYEVIIIYYNLSHLACFLCCYVSYAWCKGGGGDRGGGGQAVQGGLSCSPPTTLVLSLLLFFLIPLGLYYLNIESWIAHVLIDLNFDVVWFIIIIQVKLSCCFLLYFDTVQDSFTCSPPPSPILVWKVDLLYMLISLVLGMWGNLFRKEYPPHTHTHLDIESWLWWLTCPPPHLPHLGMER